MEIKLNFNKDVLWDSIYDAISPFFQNQDNVEGILGEDKFRTIGALTDEVCDMICQSFPSEVKVL